MYTCLNIVIFVKEYEQMFRYIPDIVYLMLDYIHSYTFTISCLNLTIYS